MLKRLGAGATGILVILLLLLFMLPAPVYAAGLGVSPGVLQISDTLRGNEYSRQVMIFSSDDAPVNVSLNSRGGIADWTTFYDTTGQNPIKELIIPANGHASALVKIKIPSDASNGDYESFLDIDTAPPAGSSDSGMSVKLHSEIHVQISVTGKQVLAGTVTMMNVKDTEIGLPMTMEVDFTNTGNVVAKPDINVKVSQEGNSVSEFTYSDTEVKVDSSEKIEVSWDTNGIKSGEYSAKVNVMLGGNSIVERDLPFRILPRGGLSGEGQLTGLKSEGKPSVGTVTKLIATLSNTGAVETVANGIAEIYLDDALVKVLDSQELVVEGGKEGELVFYFTPEKTGNYQIKVHATMAGRQTNMVQLALTVGDIGQANPASGNLATGKSLNMLYPIGGGAAIVIIAAVVFFVVKKRRSAS